MNDDFEPILDFRPINEGLGFHPFSDGLPYAPVTPNAKAIRPSLPPRPTLPAASSGTGAVQAGAPRVAVPARMRDPGLVSPATKVQAPAPTPAPASAPSVSLEVDLGWMPLFKRALAFGVDLFCATFFCALALALGVFRHQLDFQLLQAPEFVIVGVLMLATLGWALVVAQEIALGTSIGKRLLGLRLQGSMSAVLVRALLFVPSAGLFGMGLLWGILHPRRQCWHDLASGVTVTERAPL